ncbi:hypothetical protein AMJ44_04845 [candidate division WOR-1 bacterium DG_54_3]|uniref:Type 4 fimbrial biogenesis protein PilX N-terminal domain-containing protein n=1 Tax=candidate division WOR-1 bacterium DG_54_3 TaxID=1703775 RepID=A0A0S7Y2U5_UNCSA|nr:MAG: hypothetical protein AMJ44_04845 [candidate division WOR-1 bacterium DG_54_3]
MKKGFMIPFFLILVVALVAIVGSVTYLTTVSVRNIGGKTDHLKAFYIADAGLQKAIWYLTTPPEEGGKGLDWRTAGVTEEFGGGSYIISVEDDPDGLKITSRSSFGERERILQIIAGEDFSDEFSKYALLSDKDVALAEGTSVEGTTAVTEGNEISGAGTSDNEMTVIDEPSIDTTYYDNQIAVSDAGGESVLVGNQSYDDLDLNNVNLYVDGNVNVGGNVSGQADIVSSNDINVSSGAIIGRKVKLIAKNNLTVEQGAKIRKDAVLYAGENLTIGDDVITADPAIYVTPKNLKVGKRSILSGKFYGGNLNIGSETNIEGNVVGGSYGTQNVVEDSVVITKKTFDQDVPPGFKRKIAFKKWLKK